MFGVTVVCEENAGSWRHVTSTVFLRECPVGSWTPNRSFSGFGRTDRFNRTVSSPRLDWQSSPMHKDLSMPTIPTVDFFSILFNHRSFQPAVSPGFWVVFWKEGSLERMWKLPLELCLSMPTCVARAPSPLWFFDGSSGDFPIPLTIRIVACSFLQMNLKPKKRSVSQTKVSSMTHI